MNNASWDQFAMEEHRSNSLASVGCERTGPEWESLFRRPAVRTNAIAGEATAVDKIIIPGADMMWLLQLISHYISHPCLLVWSTTVGTCYIKGSDDLASQLAQSTCSASPHKVVVSVF